MNGELGTAAGRSDLVRVALRLTVEEALEGEAADALGRERYTARAARATFQSLRLHQIQYEFSTIDREGP